ncbi:Uncharacterised protein [Mycobacteroides abscessus subsp. abscessus]|nr:Uncharacterised protein [Mycobacteroides abscessus subsp. abscessus]
MWADSAGWPEVICQMWRSCTSATACTAASSAPMVPGSRPTGAASKKIRPDSRTRPQPALSISAATTSAAMASARVKPVSHTTAPATAVAMKA